MSAELETRTPERIDAGATQRVETATTVSSDGKAQADAANAIADAAKKLIADVRMRPAKRHTRRKPGSD